MLINELAQNSHPDFHDVVIHFTGRTGVDRAHPDVAQLDAEDRLLRIIQRQQFLGFSQPGTAARSVCFTEATSEGCSWLIGTGRYTSCGIAFSKQYLFTLGGGPVLQVRGDEWHHVSRMPPELRARVVRLWPGARTSDHTEDPLPWWLEGRSEWSYEREWRVPCLDSDSIDFDRAAVEFLVVPSRSRLKEWVSEVHREDPDLGRWLASARFVTITRDGIGDANGVEMRRSSSRIHSDDA